MKYLGIAYCSLRHFDKAIEFGQKYLNIVTEGGDCADEGKIYDIPGQCLLQGQFDTALVRNT